MMWDDRVPIGKKGIKKKRERERGREDSTRHFEPVMGVHDALTVSQKENKSSRS